MLGRNPHGGFEKAQIEKWDPHLNRMRHAENVRVSEQLVTHVKANFQSSYLLKITAKGLNVREMLDFGIIRNSTPPSNAALQKIGRRGRQRRMCPRHFFPLDGVGGRPTA